MKKTEQDFDKKYTMFTDKKSTVMCDEFQIGMYETYGEDFQIVLEVFKKSPKKVWTMTDCDDGMYLIQGLHYCNRVYYIITNEEATEKNEEYLFDSYEDF